MVVGIQSNGWLVGFSAQKNGSVCTRHEIGANMCRGTGKDVFKRDLPSCFFCSATNAAATAERATCAYGASSKKGGGDPAFSELDRCGTVQCSGTGLRLLR
jgi:hypothetical protein